MFTKKDYFLIKKLRDFKDYEAIETFLAQAYILVKELKLDTDTPNFLCALPEISKNMNIQFTNKVIIAIKFETKNPLFEYILPNNGYEYYEQKGLKVKNLGQLELLDNGVRPALLGFENFDFEGDIKKIWLETAKEALKSYRTNSKKYKFNYELYKLIVNNEYRNKVMEFVRSTQEIPSAMELSITALPTIQQPLNQILFGPPGTGKTYHTVQKALSIINPEFDLTQDRAKLKAEFDLLIKAGQIVFCTFHQSMSYEDFIEGIKPVAPEKEGEPLSYEIISGIFKRLCREAETPNATDLHEAFQRLIERLENLNEGETLPMKTLKGNIFSISLNNHNNLNLHIGAENRKQASLTKENIQKWIIGEEIHWKSYAYGVVEYLKNELNYEQGNEIMHKNYVLIIDEINRGNVSQIFGELITLIEEDKRIGKEEALTITLPYSKENFGVPANLYIIGTMNTADRSVEALDTALRRRFSFVEMPPRPDIIPDICEEIDVKKLLTIINKRIEKLLSKDHLIGHSFFMQARSLADLKSIFHNKIIPLLQEYFFGDYGKIGLVLGEGFVQIETTTEDIFAPFDTYEDRSFLAEKKIYHSQNIITMSDEVFVEALDTLMGK